MDSGRAVTTPALRRDIGIWGSAFLAFNGIVGAGIFAMPGTLAEQFGNFSPWLFPLFGGFILLIALPMGELAARTSVSGGPVAYTAEAFGPAVSFQVGWLFVMARVSSLAANCLVFAAYTASLWPAVGAGVPRTVLIVVLIAALTAANIVGVRRAIRLIEVLTLLKAAPVLLLAICGLALFGGSHDFTVAVPKFGEIESAALLVLYAFIAFENLLMPAEETVDPKRTLQRAMIFTILSTIALYFLVQLAYVTVMPTGSDTPLVALGVSVWGSVGGVILLFTALFSMLGNFTGNLLATPRVAFALAASGSLPGWFGKISPRYATPANSILFIGVIGIMLAVSGSFIWLAVVSTLARMLIYLATILALPVIRRKAGETTFRRPVDAAVLAGGIAVCLWAITQADWQSWQLLIASVVVGSVLYLVARYAARSANAGTVASIQPPPSTRSPS